MISIKVPMTAPIVASVIVGVFVNSTAALEQNDDASLVLDARATGLLDRNGVEVWTFDGTAGTTVSVHVDASDFDSVAYLWSPAGELVGTADEGGATLGMAPDGPLVADLPLSGRYRIEVRSIDGDGRGDYAVAVRTVRKLLPNLPVTGGTGDGGGWSIPVEVWTFGGTAGHRVHLSAITPIISLRSPLGERVAVDRDHDLFGMDWWTAVLPSTGEYQVRVHPFGSPSYEIMMRTSGGYSDAGQVEDNAAAGLPYAPELERAWSATHGDENGWTDLHYAAVLNRPDLARRLLDAGASIDARLVVDGEDFSERLSHTLRVFGFPLGIKSVVSSVLEGYSLVRCWDATPLDLAIGNGASGVAELLLNRGANLATAWSLGGWTGRARRPLIAAVNSDSVEVVELLLDRGGKVVGRVPWSGLLVADGSAEMMKLLLSRGADFETANGDTLLHHVAQSGNAEQVELLLDREMNVEAVNSAGETPLHYAVHRPWYPNLKLVELLLNRGANVEVVNDNGETPLDVAMYSEVVDLLSNR